LTVNFASASPQTVTLSGTGIADTTLSATSLSFGNVAVNTTSAIQYVKLTNNEPTALTITSLAPSSGYALDPSTSCSTASPIAGGAYCVLAVEFAPTAQGATPGTLTVNFAGASAQTVTLSGTGIADTTLSATSLSFGNVAVNTISAIQWVKLTNNEPTALTITSLIPSSGYALDPTTTCSTTSTVGANAYCVLAVRFEPTAPGATPGTLTINFASTSPQTVTLSGTGTAPVAPVTVSPTSWNFGNVAVGASSTPKTITLTNNQSTSLSISSLSVTAGSPYSIGPSSTCLSPTVTAGGSCTVILTFNPTTTGAAPAASLSIYDSASTSPQTVTLSGTGVVAATVLPTSLNFNNVAVNSTSAPQYVTLTNNQAVNLNISSITPTGPYAVTTTTPACAVGTPVTPGNSCTIGIVFQPTAVGATSGAQLSISDDATNSPQVVTLSGTGVVPVTLNPTSLAFGNVEITNTVVKNVTLTNNQSIPLHIASITGFPAGFAQNSATTCLAGTPVAGGGSCVIAVSVTPTAAGPIGGTITINDDANTAPQTFGVSATGTVKLIPSPLSLSFASQMIGTTSTPQALTLTNPQSVSEQITGVSFTGANAGDFAVSSTTCSTSSSSPLPAGGACTINVTFTPSGPGTRTATLNIGDPLMIPLTGSGAAPVTVLPGLLTYTSPVGTTSAYQTVTVTNMSTTNTIHITNFLLSGDFVQTSTSCGTAYPYALAPGASCFLTISFNPSIGGVRDGQLQVYESDVATSPQVINITGTGTSPLTLSGSLLSYGAQTVGTSSAPKTLKLTNHETQPETFTLNTTGDFIANSNCATGAIAAKSSCLIYVNFIPSSVTPPTRTGTLIVTDTAPGDPSASLTGSAIATPPPAAVSVVSPGAGAAGTTINAVITGNGWTHFNASSVITFVDTDSSSNPSDITATVPDTTTTTLNTIHAQLVITANPGVVYGARDIQVVTTLPAGAGTETALLSMAFIIADPNNSHVITNISPNFGTQGQTLNVNLTGAGTNFVDGITYANFGDGITVNSVSVSDTTDAQANITISNTTPIGYRTITLVTGGEFATSSSTAFQIGPNNATLLSISPTLTPVVPTAKPQGWSGQVYLTASGTHFLQNATQVSFTGGILSPEVTVTSDTTAVVEVAVPAGAAIGLQNATVWTGGEIATLNNAFTVIGATPALLGVAPSSGTQGQTLNVVITGNAYTTFPVGVYTHPGTDPVVADFTGEITVNSITVTSASSATVNITVSPNANIGSITADLSVNNGSGATIFSFGFAVTASNASITNVTPSCVPQGGQATLSVTGVNTLWVQGNTTAAFYAVPYENITIPVVTITDATDALLNVAVSTDTAPGTYGFYMATGGQVVSSTIKVCAATPTLTMSPANGLLPSGSTVNSFSVSFTGQFTHFGPTTSSVISGEGVTLTGFNPSGLTSATATVNIISGTNGTPTATGPRLITLTTGGEIVTTYFNVTQTPVGIISVSPSHAPPSTTKTVEIIGLNTNFVQGTTQVLFGPQITVDPSSILVKGPADLTVSVTTSFIDNGNTLPTPPGWQNIYVNTGAEQVMAGFLIDSPAQPSLVSVCVTGSIPCVSSAQQGATVDVTITGSLTHWVQNTTEAILGAGVTVSNLQILSPTVATATIAVSPTAPVGGNSVIMYTGSEIVGGTGFSVTPGGAYIYSVGPNVNCTVNVVEANGCGVFGGAGTPYVVSQLQTVVLNVVGVGTHWLQGETSFSFGPGVAIDSLTVSSPTTAQVQITVLSTSPVGYAALTTTTDGEVVTLQQAIDIEEGFPTLLVASPGGAMQGASLTLQVLGRYTNWQQGATSAAFSPAGDITVNSVTVIDADNLQLNITVSPLAYVDLCDPYGHVLTVTTGTVQVAGNTPPSGVAPSYFCVAQGAEEITNVSPNSALQQSSGTVTITGSATDFQPGISLVSFGDSGINTGTVTVNSTTSLTVPITVSTTSTVGYHTVTVTTLGEVASQVYAFSVVPGVATLNEAIPNQAEQGAPISTSPTCSTQPYCTVRLIGQYSHFSNLSTATFGAGITVQSVNYVSATEVDAQITIDPLSYTGGRLVTVTTPGVSCAFQPASMTANVTYQGCTPGVSTGTGSEIVSNNIFTIIPGPAIISQVAPATGNEGQEIVFNITGLYTHWAQNFTQFYIAGGGYDITVNSVVINSPTSATVDISISTTANPGARSIYMITNGESLTDSGAFVVTGGVPVVTYISPNSALKGTIALGVDIYGLYTQWTSAATTINFGTGVTVASYQVDNDTHIEAVLNIDPAAQVGWRTVQATTTGLPNGTQVLTGNFYVSAPAPPPTPYIWYESPSSGLPGQTFTITFYGAYTQWDPNPAFGTQLTGFNSDITVNTFQVLSPTSAVANVSISPNASASTSDLTLTTYSTTPQEVDNAQFSVVIAQPTLSVVDPGSGMQGAQNLVVNIIGQYTSFDSTTTFSFGSGITTNGPPNIIGPTIATQSISIDQLAQQGYHSVVATTADVIGLGHVVSGAGFSVTPSLALILSVTPNIAKQGDTLQVEVIGQNTHWDGSTVFTFGAGIQVNSTLTVLHSNTDVTLTISIPALASEGPTWVTATTQGEVANLNNGFVVQAGTPLLLSSSPNSRPQQGSAVFTILSQATQWTVNPPSVSFGDGVVVTNVNVTSDTSLTVNGFIQPTTYTGWRNLTVISGTQVLGLNYALYVSPGPAAINSVVPNTAGQGQELTNVTINGTNTNWLSGTTTLNFPNVLVNSWSVVNATTITADITVNDSAPAGQESVSATTLGEFSSGTNVFTVTQTQPELLSVVVASQVQGWTGTVNLTGRFTHFNTAPGCSPNCTTVNFGTGITVNSVSAGDATHIAANITVDPVTTTGYRNVSVTTGSEVVTMTSAFDVTPGPAAIQGPLNPASGAQNSTLVVHVTGSQTHFCTQPNVNCEGTTTATFGGGITVNSVTAIDLLHADVNITIPATTPVTTTTGYNVTLTTGGEVALILGGFSVTPGVPILTVVNPPTGHQGDGDAPFYVNLTGLFTHFNTAPGCSPCSVANFGAGITVNSTTASDSTHAQASITIDNAATLGSRTISVTTGAETASITGGFSVLAGLPALLNATPTSGIAGNDYSVVVNGQFIDFTTITAAQVSFGSGITVNSLSSVTTTQFTANITIAANASVGSRDITVTYNSQPVVLSGGFAVTPGTPVILTINPNIGTPGNSTPIALTLTGQYTNWTSASTVTIGTAAEGITVVGAAGPGLPGPVTFNSAISITVHLNIASGAPLGPADVFVTTGGSTQSVPGGFTVQAASIPAPSIISFSPGLNAGSSGPTGTVPINSVFSVVFSQPMNRNTFIVSPASNPTVLLYLESNPGGQVSIPITTSLDATGRVLTITPNVLPLAVNSQYYIELIANGSNYIKDATGNNFSNYGQYFYTDFTANTTPPTVTNLNPPNGATGVGTNAVIQLQFSTDMNQSTVSGVTVSNAGNSVAGSFIWNSDPPTSNSWGPGSLLTFIPSSPLPANTIYTVQWNTPLVDTAGNAVTPGAISFTTGPGSDTTSNSTSVHFTSGQTNIGTNFTPTVFYSKPVNPLEINTSTVTMYNADNGKYILGTVTVAPNGLSATFTPTYPLLPNTYYRVHQSSGYYDMDSNNLNNTGPYLSGIDAYFYTGSGSDTAAPSVASISPANGAVGIPLNAQIVVRFSAPVDPSTIVNGNAIQLSPSVAGITTLASDLVTLTFVPATTLAPATPYTVSVNGVADLTGNVVSFAGSSFTTATSIAPISVSTGFNASGQLITAGNTADANWVVIPLASEPSESTFGCPSAGPGCTTGTAQPLLTVFSGETGWYSGWVANGPNSDWITINPGSTTSNTHGLYYTTFNIPGSSVPSNLCLVGAMGVDDNGLLALNGTAIMSNISAISGLTSINIPISSRLVTGQNVLSLGWGSTDNYLEAFRLQASIQTCGASLTGGLSLTSATPSNGAGGVATNTTITLNFSNPLDPASVNSSSLPIMIGWNSNQIVAGAYQVQPGNPNQVIFTPDSPLPINTLIWVGACNGPYDLAGDYISGCYTQLTSFTTGGTAIAPPASFQVVAFTPAANATNVGLRAPVTATFNRSVNPSTINSNDFGLFNGDSQSPWCTSYNRSQDNTTLSFSCYALPSSATLTAMLNSGLHDWGGNGLTNYTSQFATMPSDSNTNGSVITTRPGSGASGISVNEPITIFTNLPINPGTANGGIEVAQNNVAVPGTVQVLDNGYTLEFTPSVPWAPGALVQWWTTGSLTDTTYNTYINTTSGYFYVAADTSTLTPTVQSISPVNGANNIALNTFFDVQFNTPLSSATVTPTNIYLSNGYSGSHLSGTYTQPQSNVVRIVPSSALPASSTIYLHVTTGLTSTTSVPAAANYWYAYTGTAMDSTLPVVTSAVPMNGETGVGVNVTPGVIFNKPIDPVSVNSNTFQVLNGATPLAGSYWFNSTNTRVNFTPSAPLPANTILSMTLNGVLDLVGNPVTFSSSFTTGAGPDFTAPYVVWTSASSNGTVPTNASMTVQFSEPMDASTFTEGQGSNCGNFRISDQLSGDGIGCIPATLTWNASQTVAYIVPSSPLAAGRQYYLAVNSGTDIAGNQVNGYGEYFTATYASASTAPTVINFNPMNGATGLGTNAVIEAQFSAPIDPNFLSGVTLMQGGSTVTTTPVMSAGNTVLQLVPSAPLAANTIYVFTIAGVTDPAGNTVATLASTFTTGATFDITAPSVVSTDPASCSTSAASCPAYGTNVIPKIVFNKPLNPIGVTNSYFELVLNDTGQYVQTTVSLSVNGMEVTLTPQVPLLPNTEYRFSNINGGGSVDEDGNYTNLPWYYFYTGSGAVTSDPTVTISPLNGATGIPTNAQIVAAISAPIDPTTWNQNSIQLLNGATPVAGTVSLTNIQMLTFAPTSALSTSTTYTVNVSGFTDANGNTVVPSTTTFTTGSVASTGGLSITSTNIGNGATNVSATSPIIITFNHVLDPATVNNGTLDVFDGWSGFHPLAGTLSLSPSGNQVTFTPANPYPSGANIAVGSCNGPTDVLGNVLSGGCWSQLLSFTVVGGTPATTPFSVLSVSPANGVTNIGRDQSVSVTFSNSVNPGTVGSYNMQLYAGQSLQNSGSVTMSADGRTITFNQGALNNGTTYTIFIPAGGVTDDWGNTLSSPYTSTFTTMADPATGNGSVQSAVPGNTSGIPTDTLLTLYMNRQVNSSTVSGNLTVTVNGQVYAGITLATADGYEIQFTPITAFPNSATVQWFLSGNVMDVNGNYFNSASGYFYTVAAPSNPATTVPQVVAVSPYCCGSTNVPTNAEIDIQYNVPLDATTLSGNVYRNGSPTTPYTVALAPGTTNVVRITPTAPWNASGVFYGFCTNSNVKSYFPYDVAAQGDCYATYFYTTAGPDTTAGTVTIGPPNGVINVGTNAFIRLQFSKPVDKTTINSTNVAVTTSGNPIDGTWSYNISNSDVVGVNFTPVNPLPPSSLISVNVSGLLDYAGNTFTAATSNFTTAATPDYSTPTVTLDFGSGQTGIATNASFTCHYSEAMDPSSVNSSNTYIYSYVAGANNWATDPWTYTWSSDLTSVTMTPTSPLFANSQYYYACYNAIDLTGNGQSNSNTGFYTGNGPLSQGPTLLYANPPNGMTNVPVDTSQGPWYNSSLGLLFNEPVAGDSLGNITLTPLGGSPIPIGAYTEYGNTIVWVQLPYSLQPNTQYTYNISGVTDINGNAITPVTSTFTTGAGFDFTSPTVVSTSPANGVTTTGVPTSVSMTTSEALNPVLITSSQFYLRNHNTQATVPTTISISSSATPSVATTITLTPTTPLAESTMYDIYYYPNNWWPTDIAGNNLSNYGSQATFTTGTTAPMAGVCGSANGGTFSIPPTANLCSTGTATGQTNSGGVFSWSCSGQYGGTASSCSATITPASACYAQPAGLVSWWRSDDDATDHMGHNNGTLENGAGFALGAVNDAFSFNGSNQYVLIGSSVPADLQIQNNITMSAWVYLTSYPANGSYYTVLGSENSSHDGIGLYIYGGGNNGNGRPPGSLDLDIGNGSSWYSAYTTSQLPLNQWVLVTAVASANQPDQFYFNGVLQPYLGQSGESIWNGTVSYSGTWFAIGQSVSSNWAFNGLIDEVQIYNTALTAAQVQGIYNAGNAGVCP
jgi:LEA14-like dessication related protein